MNYEQRKQKIHSKYYVAMLKYLFDLVKEAYDQAQEISASLCPHRR